MDNSTVIRTDDLVSLVYNIPPLVWILPGTVLCILLVLAMAVIVLAVVFCRIQKPRKKSEIQNKVGAAVNPDEVVIENAVYGYSFGNSRSTVDNPPSTGSNLPSPVDNPPSPVDNPPSPVDNPPSPVDNPPSTVDNPPSPVDKETPTIHNPPSNAYNAPSTSVTNLNICQETTREI